MAGLSKAPNLEMRQAILTLAGRFGGMTPSDCREHGTTHAVNQCAQRMAKRGELHMGDNSGSVMGGRRQVRFFIDKDHRDFWVKQQTAPAYSAPITPPSQPAAWAPGAVAQAGTATLSPPPTASAATGRRSHHTKRLRGDATVQGLDTAPHHRMASRLAEHLMRGESLRARTPTDLPFVPRPGSMDFRQHPTRIGTELRYLDGRVEQMQHAQTTATATA